MTPPWTHYYAKNAPDVRELPLSVPQALESACSQFTTRTALELAQKSMTYAHLQARVRTVAQGLLDSGVRAGDRVAIVVPMSMEAVISFHAVLRIGAVAVQHSANEPMAQLARLFEDYTPVAAIVTEKRLDALAGVSSAALPKTVISVPANGETKEFNRVKISDAIAGLAKAGSRTVLRAATGPLKVPAALSPRGIRTTRWRDLLLSTELPAHYPFPDPGNLATIMYPQRNRKRLLGAMLTHSNLTALAVQSLEWLEGSEPGTEVSYALWPLHSVTGVADTLTTGLFHGRHNILFPRFEPATLARTMKKHPPTVVAGDTHVFDFLAQRAREGDTSALAVRFAFTRLGDTQDPRSPHDWGDALGYPVVVGYGSAESCVISGLPMRAPGHHDSVGVPFPSTRVRVVDPHNRGRILPPGTVGRLMVKGPQVFHGYWNKPDETAAVLSADGWVLTQDLASVDAEGFVTLRR